MLAGLRHRWTRLRTVSGHGDEAPTLADENRWYTEHTALLISTLKWAMLGAIAGGCVGLGTRVFLWALDRSADWARALTPGRVPVFIFLPIALPLCISVLDSDVLSFYVAKVVQSQPNSLESGVSSWIGRR